MITTKKIVMAGLIVPALFLGLFLVNEMITRSTPERTLRQNQLGNVYKKTPESQLPTQAVAQAANGYYLPSSVGKEYGTWVWKSANTMTLTEMKRVISNASLKGVNVIYLTIDDYLNIYSLPESKNKTNRKAKYLTNLETFVRLASEADIQVDTEAGWRDWSKPANRWKGLALIDFTAEYNRLKQYKVRGFQYDVEPYLLTEYESNKASVLREYMEYLDISSKKIATADLAFSVVIPHFYDAGQQWTPSFEYNGTTTYAFNHILRILNTIPQNTSVVIMAYRNFAEGENGVNQISEVEVQDASALSDNKTPMIIAQESGNVEPNYVTYYGWWYEDYLEQITLVQNHFMPFQAYGGMAIHYLDTLMLLKQ